MKTFVSARDYLSALSNPRFLSACANIHLGVQKCIVHASCARVRDFSSFQVYLQISGLHVTVNSKSINKYTFNIYVVMAVYKISA